MIFIVCYIDAKTVGFLTNGLKIISGLRLGRAQRGQDC